MKATDSDFDIVKIAVGLIALIIATIVHGFVIMMLWGWFAVPLGVKAITTAHAIGFSALFGMFATSGSGDGKSFTENLVKLFVHATVALLLGWIAKGFMGT